jgi:hypothetical protein
VRCASTWILDRWLLKPDATAALLPPPTDCLATAGAVLVIHVDTAIPASRAMRPPVHHRPVFSSSQSPAVPISRDPAVRAAATRRKRGHHPLSASPRSGTLYRAERS